ncbi:MAG: hypothetical protein ACD_76C00100G0002 [uncultured bacterium]|nr:MAG: hypothetical protein ACD_76C00100G0002 [uncultured bacterium]
MLRSIFTRIFQDERKFLDVHYSTDPHVRMEVARARVDALASEMPKTVRILFPNADDRIVKEAVVLMREVAVKVLGISFGSKGQES